MCVPAPCRKGSGRRVRDLAEANGSSGQLPCAILTRPTSRQRRQPSRPGDELDAARRATAVDGDVQRNHGGTRGRYRSDEGGRPPDTCLDAHSAGPVGEGVRVVPAELPRSNSREIRFWASGGSETVTRAPGRSSTITLKLGAAPGRGPRGWWIPEDTKATGPTRTAREPKPSSSSSRTRIAQPLITVPSGAVGGGTPRAPTPRASLIRTRHPRTTPRHMLPPPETRWSPLRGRRPWPPCPLYGHRAGQVPTSLRASVQCTHTGELRPVVR
jgi:hypothetical protein